jgi:phosphoribosylformylglycinamidine synthase subunit PurQ / glutaminase
VSQRMAPHALILTAAGVNCDRETVEAARLAGAEAERVHLNQLLSGERRLLDFSMLVIPGGFSYGDHLGAGAVLATMLRHHLLDDLHRFIADGRPVLGICNGFQVLSRLGLLGEVALVPNEPGGFLCRWVRLRVERTPCLFLRGIEEFELPIAHGEGRVVVGGALHAPLRYLDNPNGSTAGIAGVCNAAGNVFGLMPHPERYVMPYQHPRRRRGEALPPLGLTLFQNAVRHVQVGC